MKHLDREGDEVESIIWASSPEVARKKAEAQFDDVLDVQPISGLNSGALILICCIVLVILLVCIRIFVQGN